MADDKLNRTFVAVDFSDEVVKEVSRVQEILGNWKFTGKMTELGNLHLTLKFLGKLDDRKLNKIKEELGKIGMEKFEARLERVGLFMFRGNPRIVWVKIGGQGIFELQEKADLALEKLGFEREKRFMSHMTIARVKYVKDKKGFREYAENIKLRDVRFEVDRFKLKVSELKDFGPVYDTLREYRLR